MRHLKQSRFNEKRLNRGTRLGSHLHLRIRTPSIHPTDDGRDSIQSDDLALMCLRSRCKCRFFVWLFSCVSFDVLWGTQHIIHFGYWLFRLWKLTLTTDQLETQHFAHYVPVPSLSSITFVGCKWNRTNRRHWTESIRILSKYGLEMKFQDVFKNWKRSFKQIQMKINGFCGQNMYTQIRNRTHGPEHMQCEWKSEEMRIRA